MADAPLLRLEQLSKRYGGNNIFAGVSLTLMPGECLALLGESGVGKSTLLNCIAGLDDATAGEVWLAQQRVGGLDETQRAALRRQHLGFVFQAFHVLPHLIVRDNVSLPLRLLGQPFDAEVDAVLRDVGLATQATCMPAQLSGGQLQRVAIARALVHRPQLILADEPTGNLDPDTAERVLDLLLDRVRQQGAGCLIVTHSRAAARRADRVLRLTARGIVPEAANPPGPLGEGPGAPANPRATDG
jgi:putative ABC transport system ATP-binding protein